MNPSGTNDLVITVGGDLSAFEAALDTIPGLAQSAFGDVQSAIQAIDLSPLSQSADTVATSLSGLSDAAAATATGLADTGAALDAAGTSLETVASSTTDAVTATQALTPALNDETAAANEASGGFAEMAEKLVALGEALAVTEGLKELGEEALTAYGNVQQASISIAALTGDSDAAAEAIENLESLATSDALSFPSLLAADQKMTALGFSAAQTSQILQDAANAAAASGAGFDQAANAIDRMALSGAAGGRQLAALGISAQQLATIMNTSAAGVTAAFKALDQSDRLAVLDQALQKFSGDAALAAQSINGAWQNLKTQWDFVLESLGSALAPVVQQIAQLLSGVVIPAIKAVIDSLNALPGPLKDTVVIFGVAVAAIAPLSVALGTLALGLSAAAGAWATFAATETGSAITGTLSATSSELLAVANGAAVASSSLTVLGAAVIQFGGILVAGIAGWALGTWAYNQVPGMKALGDATADLILDIPGVTALINRLEGVPQAQATMAASAEQLNEKLMALGITIPQGSMSVEQWGAALAAAAAKVPSAIQSVQQFNNTVKGTSDAETTLYGNLQAAENALGKVTIAYTAGVASQGQYQAALDAVNKAQTALNGSGLVFAETMNQVLIAFNNAGTNAATTAGNFQLVSNAFAAGHATLSQYTTALDAMNKAQMDANNGIELAGTALLVAENAYRLLEVAATNALTNVTAVAAAVDAGQASWTQYVTALTALNKAQEDANGGLQELGTAVAMVDAAYTNLGVSFVNAQTNLEAVDIDVANGTAGFVQHVEAVNAVQAAYVKLGSGILDYKTALQQANDTTTLANNSLTNLMIQLQAAYENWVKTGQGAQQYLDIVLKLPAAQQAANNGLITAQTATLSVAAAQEQANNALTNANTMLAQASAAYANGSISLGTYEKYLQAQKTAQDAVNGSTNAGTAATNAATTANHAYAASLPGTTSALQAASSIGNDYATSLQYINGQYIALGGQSIQASDVTSTFASNLSVVNGVLQSVGTSALGSTTDTDKFATSLAFVNGQMVNIASNAGKAASGIQSIGAAAKSVATTVQDAFSQMDDTLGPAGFGSTVDTLAAELDKLDASTADAFDSLNGATTSVNTTPTTMVGSTPGGQGNLFPLGALTGAGIMSGGYNPFETNHQMLDPYAANQATLAAEESATKAATTATTAYTTAVTAAATATTSAITNYNQYGQVINASGQAITGVTQAIGVLTDNVNESSNAVLNQIYDTAFGTQVTEANTTATQANTTAVSGGLTPIVTMTDNLNQWNVAMSPIPGVTQAVYDALAPLPGTFTSVNGNISDLGLSTAQLNAINDAANPVAAALDAQNKSTTKSVAALGLAAYDAGTALMSIGTPSIGPAPGIAGLQTTVQGETPAQIAMAEMGQDMPGLSGVPQIYGLNGLPLSGPGLNINYPTFGTPGPNQGIGNGTSPILGGTAGTGLLNPSPTPSLTINVSAGTVVGANGMQQLSTMVGNQLVQTLSRMGYRLNRQ